ncbi:MAG TPA: hypothetical protein DCY18_05365, partial [Thauera sp.]|nr:hypothetical protein [Thauera sp.]
FPTRRASDLRKLMEGLPNQPVGAAENAEAVAKALVAWIESVEERLGELKGLDGSAMGLRH